MRISLEESIKIYGGFYIVCGCGNDSAMMIAECYSRGFEPKAVIFCNTGNEMPHTYQFLAKLSVWMMSKGWSKLVILEKHNADGDVINVYDENYKHGRMPPPVYNYKTCSQRFKTEVADRWIAQNEGKMKPVKSGEQVDWKNWGKKVVKAVGINADEEYRAARWKDSDFFETVYPLVDWDVGEMESKDLVESIGLYMPGKSSCFMCPNMKAHEIVDLHNKYPLLFHKAIAMEYNVIEQGNDVAEVNRVFIKNELTGDECKMEDKLVKKTDRVIDLNKTLESMSMKNKMKFGLISDGSQMEMFGDSRTKLIVRKVKEQTGFVGLGRTCSWLDVIKEYSMTGQVDMFSHIGGEMCPDGACGL